LKIERLEMPNVRRELNRIVAGLRRLIRQQGLVRAGCMVATVVGGQIGYPIIRARRRRRTFSFRGQKLGYAFARYNSAFLSERTVEIAIARHFLAGPTGRMLEVGNVLAHFGHTGHTVVDKYELAPGVLNVDLVDFVPERPYDTVVSISTLEHIGWDEQPRDPDKVLRAVRVVRDCVADGGRVLITIPVGYNERVDAALRVGEVKFPDESWLVRTNRRNEWVETDRDDAMARRYGHPFIGANGLYVGMIS
jgi:hypothetical protein